MTWLWVAVGGALGAMSRMGIALLFQPIFPRWPLATLFVNVLGALLIGFAYGYVIDKNAGAQMLRSFFMVGFLGAFTTYSTFALETVSLVEAGQWRAAVLSSVLNLVGSLSAVVFGLYLYQKIA